MGQLVTEQLLALGRLGVVLAGGEVEVGAVREGQGADRGGLVADVDADVGEAGVEERLHLLLDRFGQRLAAAAWLEREIGRQGEGIARLRLKCGGARRLRKDRMWRLVTHRLCGLDRPGLGMAGRDRSPRISEAGLHRAWRLRPYRRCRYRR